MLTAKGIGGGGAAEVTNGVLQEMYAAEGEIPANTFVDVRKSVVPSDDAEKIVILSEDRIESNSDCIPSEVYSDLLLSASFDSPASGVSGTNMNIHLEKLEQNIFIGKEDLVIHLPESGVTWSAYKNAVFIQLSGDKIMLLFTCISKSSSEKISIKYVTLNISEDGQLSVHKEVQTIKLGIFDSMNPDDDTIKDLRIKRVDDHTLCLFIARAYNKLIQSGTIQIDAYFYAQKLSIEDYNLTIQGNSLKFDEKRLTHTSGATETVEPTYDIANISLYENNFILTYSIEKLDRVFQYRIGAINLNTWTYSLLSQGDLKSMWENVTECYILEDRLVTFSRPSNTKLDAYIYQINKYSDDRLKLTKLSSQTNLQNIGKVYLMMEPVLYLGDNRFIINCPIESSEKNRYYVTIREFTFDGKQLNPNTNWFNLNDIAGIYSTKWFLTPSGLIVTIYYYETYAELKYLRIIWTFGALDMFAYNAKSKISGVTKTKCTKTQKGQVWMLNTQEGEQ